MEHRKTRKAETNLNYLVQILKNQNKYEYLQMTQNAYQ